MISHNSFVAHYWNVYIFWLMVVRFFFSSFSNEFFGGGNEQNCYQVVEYMCDKIQSYSVFWNLVVTKTCLILLKYLKCVVKIIKPKHIFNKTYRIILTKLFQKVNSMSRYLSGSSEWIFSNVCFFKDQINFHSYYSKGFRHLLSSSRVAFSNTYNINT